MSPIEKKIHQNFFFPSHKFFLLTKFDPEKKTEITHPYKHMQRTKVLDPILTVECCVRKT